MLLKQLLKAYEIIIIQLEALKGMQAIGLARDEQPDLILMDLRLP
jgi:DNA-binding NarL/FixJ family response regulator